MTASGFVMNVDKMKNSSVADYLCSKTIRLLLPMTTWFLIFLLHLTNLTLSSTGRVIGI